MACIVPASAPASADSSACTHNWSGPQVCVRLEGRNGWNSVTAIWANPPKSVKKRAVRLTLDGHQLGGSQTARRVGGTISYKWSGFEQGTGIKVCIHFTGIDRVACEETKYIGDRASF